MDAWLSSIVGRIDYFRWELVAAYCLLVGVFVYGVLRPRGRAQWRSMGWAQAWVVALYVEMYGVPLTAYLVMGWLGRPAAEAEVHFNGHLWPLLFGGGVTAQIWTDVIGQLLIAVGAVVALVGWRQIHRAVREERLCTGGLYAWVRHPQYTGFFLFLAGSVLNWPTLPTLLLLPVLIWVYLRLAADEEADALAAFGDRYRAYRAEVGAFLPFIGRVPFEPAEAAKAPARSAD